MKRYIDRGPVVAGSGSVSDPSALAQRTVVSSSAMILGHAIFMAAVHDAAQNGRLDLHSANLTHLALRPLLLNMMYVLGHHQGLEAGQVDVLIRALEIEDLLESSRGPRETFELAYATGNLIQYAHTCTGGASSYRLRFSIYLREAAALLICYKKPIERLGREMDLEKIMHQLALGPTEIVSNRARLFLASTGSK